jgi:hypothetical protein
LDAVKFVKGSDSLIEGLAIPFGGPIAGKDLDGEDFGPDTDYALDWFPQGRPVIYHHGIDSALKTAVQGRQVEHEITDEGVWARAQLDVSAKYHATVSKLIAAGKLFFSSGSIPHLVDVDDAGHIKRWPWVELSLTPTPANPLAAVHAVKAADVIEHLAAANLSVPSELIASALKALDATPSVDDSPPDGLKYAALLDRVVEESAWLKTRSSDTKSGRVLSAASLERLATHTPALRQVADDIDDFVMNANGPKSASADLLALLVDTGAIEDRLIGLHLAARGIRQ